MIIKTLYKGKEYRVNLSLPLDLSVPLRAADDNITAWYVKPPVIEPVVMGDWIGDVKQGGSVNFRNVFVNPHGHGTHTECVGHISKEDFSLNQCLKKFMFFAELVSVTPEISGEDRIITLQQLKTISKHAEAEAFIIRTLPNEEQKKSRQYSGTNPPYLHHEAAAWLATRGVKHLLLDLPSVDREKDEGKLLAHRAFWNYPENTRTDCTISELIFVPDEVSDGLYLLNIQITALENDASPSKPILYELHNQE